MYPILLSFSPATSPVYNVSAYPTIYLIDREGKILLAQSGFGEGMEDRLEDIIQKNRVD